MPEVSRFLGIVIFMLYDDHRPPHFHARYGDYAIEVDILSGVVQGRFPRRALGAVVEWATEHKQELIEDWKLAEQHEPLKHIEPLE